jgi:hypothetical protein
MISVTKITPYQIDITWQAPNDHGCPINRFDIMFSSKRTQVMWCRLACGLLGNTTDVDKLFGVDKMKEFPPNSMKGLDSMCMLDCDECVYSPLETRITSFEFKTLVPGRNYYFMVRAVSDAGKAEWSWITEAMRTPSLVPRFCDELVVEETGLCNAVLSLQLPYDNGSPVTDAVLVVKRQFGPISEWEASPDEPDGIRGNHRKRQYDFDPREHPWAADVASKATDSLPGEARYRVELDDLLPGTGYEVWWKVKNAIGDSEWSDGAKFCTLCGIPDPPDMILHGGDD